MNDRTRKNCDNAAIRDLLPDHAFGSLDAADHERLEGHLAVCEDCKRELRMLRLMADDPVPEPAGAFWTTMPDRVYRAVQEERSAGRVSGIHQVSIRALLFRWSPAAAAAAVLVLLSWITVLVERQSPLLEAAREHRYVDAASDAGFLNIHEFDRQEINALADWAGRELAAVSREAAPLLQGAADSDIDEELADLDPSEHERLQLLIDRHRKEERT